MAEQNIGFIGVPSSDHDVIVSIVVEISRVADGEAHLVARRCPRDAEALAAWEGCQIDVGKGGGGAVTEDDVHRSAVSASRAVESGCTDYNIAEPIVIYISCTAQVATAVLINSSAQDLEASTSGAKGRQVNCVGLARAVPENNVGNSCT
jgi:hypothetical protein